MLLEVLRERNDDERDSPQASPCTNARGLLRLFWGMFAYG
jgi:hypothetical protein